MFCAATVRPGGKSVRDVLVIEDLSGLRLILILCVKVQAWPVCWLCLVFRSPVHGCMFGLAAGEEGIGDPDFEEA